MGICNYAREQAIISRDSLSDLCTKNSVNISSLENIIERNRHYGVFIDIPLGEIDSQANAATADTSINYKIPQDITFSGVLDLKYLNPIFNSFPILTSNYFTLLQELWKQDFLQDLKVVWLNKNDAVKNNHLAYHTIPPEKLDIIYLLSDSGKVDKTREYQGFNI
ncbi:MAG: hypothetical protein EZS28_000790 [Streblomastix strix]|uniref:Uncharacterized protein n=1 Tax=Streblomastix strix TaxID=222440 RepID=A0A5J4X910_9EUKA|nr:MAG: hypothetical protein EZS28_000790 [Streblomastix strix]